MNAEWPEIFKTGDISGRSDRELCADGLTGWGLCRSGSEYPDSKIFGNVVVEISKKLGTKNGTEEELHKWADEHLEKRPMIIKHHTVVVEMSITTLHADTDAEAGEEIGKEISAMNNKLLYRDFPPQINKIVSMEEI